MPTSEYEMEYMECFFINFDYLSVLVPQTIPLSVIPTVDGDSVLFQVFINVSSFIKYMMIVDEPKNEAINYKLQSMSHRNYLSMSCSQMLLRTCNHKECFMGVAT